MTPTSATDDPMTDFTARHLDLAGDELTVWTSGRGPAVVLLPEMPGISPDVLRFGRWIRDAGLTVYLPSLFGVDGAYPQAEAGTSIMKRACVSREFHAFAGGGTSPIATTLRALAGVAHAECGGPGVGAVGLCFTGNFALTMMLDDSVVAAVVNHPSLPLDDPGGLELSEADGHALRRRLDADDLRVSGYRFDTDRWCTAARFAAYAELLGDRFDGRVLPGSSANPSPPPFFADVVGTPHSVVTAHLVDEAGHPTIRARDEIVDHLTAALLGGSETVAEEHG
ncbi:dienelactone hydrolase family protein [uncultured Gordonia sp.]|uniref:dienelactone hydrolase family protein n=1 Tax=uncultured Gordonia sp. TaxID=198437 RepID=UPI00258979A6|nr:dienelactone hydrolase family protein [uncultured Gordonia sp.]